MRLHHVQNTLKRIQNIRAVGQVACAVRFDVAAVCVLVREELVGLGFGGVHFEGAFDAVFLEGGPGAGVVGEAACEDKFAG